MKFGLTDSTIEQFNSVFRKFPEIEKVIIYGSRAKGDFREGSDIDLTLIGEKITDEIKSVIWLELDGLNTPYLIDISAFHQLKSKDLIDHIVRVGKKFYTKQSEYQC